MSKQYFVRCVETVECKVCGGTGRISIATDYATTDSGTITSLCVHCNAGQRQVHSWLDLSEALQDMDVLDGLILGFIDAVQQVKGK